MEIRYAGKKNGRSSCLFFKFSWLTIIFETSLPSHLDVLRRGGTRTGVLCSWRHKSLRIGSAWKKIGLRKTGGRPVSPIKQHGEGEAYYDFSSIFQHISAYFSMLPFISYKHCLCKVHRIPSLCTMFLSLFNSFPVIFRYSMALLSQMFTFYSLIVFLRFHCFISVFVVARKSNNNNNNRKKKKKNREFSSKDLS